MPNLFELIDDVAVTIRGLDENKFWFSSIDENKFWFSSISKKASNQCNFSIVEETSHIALKLESTD